MHAVLHSYDVRVSKLIVQLLMISLITVLMAFEAHSPAIDDLSHHSVDGFHFFTTPQSPTLVSHLSATWCQATYGAAWSSLVSSLHH
jgi:hypothetical protein